MENTTSFRGLDIDAVRRDFPILNESVNGHDLIYLDNAATTQKPQQVIDAVANYYAHNNSNVHRGVHALSIRATEMYESARMSVKKILNANFAHECIFTRGTTDAVNLVASSFVMPRVLPGEEILITTMEHHSNIVPWQMVCEQTGAKLVVTPISEKGEVLLEEFEKKLSKNTKFVAISHVSNALGTINPVKEMIAMAHAHGALVLLDGAQAMPHVSVDVQGLDCDFYAFSGHKMYGPTGVGVLWGREEFLNDMRPYQGGGEMIAYVRFDKTEYAPLPHKFEAGTPNIAGVIGLGAAINYLQSLDLDKIFEYEQYLLEYATLKLEAEEGFKIIGTASNKVPVISFIHEHIHAHDLGTILDSEGIAIRAGHHCAMPLMDFYNVAATARLSLSFYNTIDEIDTFINTLQKAKEVFL
ncbi:MAG: cysteine desulfurase [Legionellaceae bacterium]|nr:cysteine desulfurase [Legionellaceae bacterium]